MNWQIIDTASFYHTLLFIGALVLWITTFAFPILSLCSLQLLGKLGRSYLIGIPLAALCVWWVIPHAAILLNYVHGPEECYILLPYAGIFYLLCVIFLDFLASRAIAGIIILYAYTTINASFIYTADRFMFLTPYYIVTTLFFTGFAIWVAAKPYLMRDFLYYIGHNAPKWLVWVVWFLLLILTVTTTVLYSTTFYM